jgi:uncharacterized phage protein (TIGR02216 family)
MFPWSAWLAHACAAFGIAPRAFWRLSLREWRALNGTGAVAPLTRDELAALASRFPDLNHG